jgi:hypothetical protein
MPNTRERALLISICVRTVHRVIRRALSAAAITVVEGSEKTAVKLGTVVKNATSALATTTEDKTAFWEPDPETRYYRPVTGTKEVDAADLRAQMLKQRIHDGTPTAKP